MDNRVEEDKLCCVVHQDHGQFRGRYDRMSGP